MTLGTMVYVAMIATFVVFVILGLSIRVQVNRIDAEIEGLEERALRIKSIMEKEDQ